MKTAQELADDADLLAVGLELAFQDSNAADVRRYAAMLRQQAEQIKKLQRNLSEETENVKSFLSKCQSLEIERDALKADAERYRWWVTQVEHKDFENLEKAFKSMEVREDVTKQMMDTAIDAMKGKS